METTKRIKWSRIGHCIYYGRGAHQLYRIMGRDPITWLVEAYEPELISWRMITKGDTLGEAILFAETEECFT